MISNKLFLLMAFWLVPAHADWKLVYQNGQTGETLAGDKSDLVAAIRSGASIRVAWGVQHPENPKRTVEHVVEPVFITISDGNEVFIQTPEHIAQTSYWNPKVQDFNNPAVVWRGLLSSTGSFTAVWTDRSSGQTVRRLPQQTTISWFVHDQASNKAKPFYSSTGESP